MSEHLAVNRASWNRFVSEHLSSDFYDVAGFLAGQDSLNEPELELLGDVRGLRILHLQCHFGMDSISLARRGANVTAVDLSEEAIKAGQELAEKDGQDVRFIVSDVLAEGLLADEEFDMVFTSYGAITWLKDLDIWAERIAHWLRPDGRLVLAEFHPLLGTFNDEFTHVEYPYFNTGAIEGSQRGSYAARDSDLEFEYKVWNHHIGEVLGCVIGNGMSLEAFHEYDYSPYNCFPGLEEHGEGRYVIEGKAGLFPMVYSFSARKV